MRKNEPGKKTKPEVRDGGKERVPSIRVCMESVCNAPQNTDLHFLLHVCFMFQNVSPCVQLIRKHVSLDKHSRSIIHSLLSTRGHRS